MGSPAVNGAGRYVEANRALWNSWTKLHEHSPDYDLAGFLAGRCRLKPAELAELPEAPGKTMLHLQCHFGLDTLSWARRGVDVTGVDFSEDAITLARRVAADAGIPARFIHSDVYALPQVLDADFDIVFTSYGVLTWLPDLRGWAEVVARYLKPGGTFYMVEIHPFAMVFQNEGDVDRLEVHYPYFPGSEPIRCEGQGSYAAPDAPIESVSYEWPYTMGGVLTSLIEAGLRVDFVHEFDYTVYRAFPFLTRGEDGMWRMPPDVGQVPLLFSVKARKGATTAIESRG